MEFTDEERNAIKHGVLTEPERRAWEAAVLDGQVVGSTDRGCNAILRLRRDAAKGKDWRNSYPVGSECEVMWCGEWKRATVRDHAAAECLGVEIGTRGVINRRLEDVRPIQPAAKGKDWREAYPVGSECEIRFGDGRWHRAIVEAPIDNAYLTVRTAHDRSAHFGMEREVRHLAAPLGEMLPNGFRVGEKVESLCGKFRGAAVPAPIGKDNPDVVWAVFAGSGVDTPTWLDTNEIRRVAPATAVPPPSGPVLTPHGYYTASPEKALCPCCHDTPLRLVGEARDVYRCGHCQWTGSAEKLAEARKPEMAVYRGAIACPCGARAALTAHGVYACGKCGWSGGEQLAKQRRAAKARKFKVGDRVGWAIPGRATSGGISTIGQVMEVLDGGYKVVNVDFAGTHDKTGMPDLKEVTHNVSESDLQPWPPEAP